MSDEPVQEFKVCECECGGQVWGLWDFGQPWTWCDKCSPVTEIKDPRKDPIVSKESKEIVECALVSQLGIVIAHFKRTRKCTNNAQFMKYDGRIFEKRHEHGGGRLTYYEVSYIELSKNDIEGMQPL
jgi:hypothetical protein